MQAGEPGVDLAQAGADGKRRHKRKRAYVMAGLLLIFILGTLAGIPIGRSPNKNIAISGPYVSAAAGFAPLNKIGVIPANIMAATAVPAGAQVVGRDNLDRNNGPFDREVLWSTPLGAPSLLTLERTALAHFGWTVRQTTVASRTTTIYAQKAGADGNYWDVAIGVAPESAASSAASGSTMKSRLTLRLLIQHFQ